MGCCGNRKKKTKEFADQKWDYINLQDFKAKGCGAPLAYGWVWFSLILSVTVYSVDSFTAVNLLVYDRWSSKIQPKVPLKVSKWIFSICIILSFINLAFEGVRAWRVMRRENVAECYMDNLAVKWESIRLGRGQGWKRFLVFAALTKSKKGSEYIALFTYVAFKSWIRVILCSGPRQVVNAMTLISVYQAQLEYGGDNVGDSIKGFFDKIGALAREDYQQAVILSGMAFTFVIWAISALTLLMAVLFYVFFLFHWIPRSDGGLSGYCERKVNKTLLKIVTKTVNKALAKQEAKAAQADAIAFQRGEKPQLDRMATLPTLPNMGPDDGDSLAAMPVVKRQNTSTSLLDSDRPGTPSNIEMTRMPKRPIASRTGTNGSAYSASQPLISGAADMGYGRPVSPAPSLPSPPVDPAPPYGNRTPGPPSIRPGTGMLDRRQPTVPNMDALPPQSAGGFNGAPVREPTLPNMEAPMQGGTRAPTMPNMREPTLPNMGEPTLPNMGEPTLPNLSEPTADFHRQPQSQMGQPTFPNVGFVPPQRPGTANSLRPEQASGQVGNSFGTTYQSSMTASPEMMDTAVMPSFPGEDQKNRNMTSNAYQGNPQSHQAPYGAGSRPNNNQNGYSNRPAQPSATPGPVTQPPQQYGAYQGYAPQGRSSPAPSSNPYRQGTPVNRGQTPMGQPPMGQRPAGQPPRGQTPMGQTPMGQPPMGQPPRGQTPIGNGPPRRDLTGPSSTGRGTPEPYRNMASSGPGRAPQGDYFGSPTTRDNSRGPSRDAYGTPRSQAPRTQGSPGYSYGYDVESQRGGQR